MPRRVLLSAIFIVLSAAPAVALAEYKGTASGNGVGARGAAKPFFNRDAVPPRVEKALGGRVAALPDGGFKVDPARGPALYTHGPDPVIAGAKGGSAGVPGTIDPYGTGGLTDPPLCTGSPNGDYYQHVLYGRPSGTTSRLEQFRSSFVSALFQMNYVLDRDSEASGGPSADYKFLCNPNLTLNIGTFTNSGPNNFSAVVSAARAAGFNKQNVDYTIFYDGDPTVSQCGVGGFFSDEDPTANNINNLGNNHGITWVDCWFTPTPMHENGHNQGAVQYNSPHSTGTGAHCWDENDIMCYSPDGGDKHQQGTQPLCAGVARFDCGFDDYFDAAPEGGEYLADNWNVASSANRFLVFGAGGGGNQPPTAAFAYDCEELDCQFTDQSSDDAGVDTWHWTFGDGGLANSQQNPAHTFPSSGTYNVTLVVEDAENLSDFVEVPVTVSDGTNTKLTNRVTESRTAGAQDTFDRLKFKVPRSARKVTIKISGEGCDFVSEDLCVPDLDLYVRIGAQPTLSQFHCRPFRYGIAEKCTGRAPGIRGMHHIGVYNFAAAPGTPYDITATHRR
jgi:PKD repeat protein